MIAHIKVYIAYLTNNRGNKSEDLHGRSYISVYKKFGHKEMVKEFNNNNTWLIK